jgi:hypothetical protein
LEFTSKYSKEYPNKSEFHRRFEIFRASYKKVLEHNAIGMEFTGFEMGINHFSDLTEEEFM